MQFIADGPDIPVEILRAQEDGSLVLFCGAGISIPAGLPSFKGLVEAVYQGLGATPSPAEERELAGAQPSFDRILNLLEGPKRFSPAQVRREVARILATPASPTLDTHQAILKLARGRNGSLRLVTTNYDLLFELAEPGVRRTSAPLLPVPKHSKWDHLVYLHGRLDDSDPDGVHLVLTSGDFGTAYLVERWASRFVTELFRHFTVLFVGYAVDDPPMRYLVDAIAAERRVDRNLHPAFAVAGCRAGARDEEATKWAAKGITAVLYDDSGGHDRLHRTLKEWSRIWAGGLQSKLAIVADLGANDPGSLPVEAQSQFVWAISDESGAVAAELGRLQPAAKLAWLDVLEKAGALAGPPHPASAKTTGLVDDGRTTDATLALDPVRRGLAAWLAGHLGDPALARWMVKRGGRLHPEVQELIRWKLKDVSAVPPHLRKVWLALTGSVRLRRGTDVYHRFGFHNRISHETWGPTLRAELLAALAPCLELSPSWSSSTPIAEGDEDGTDDTVASILSVDCELEAGQSLEMLLEQLAARTDWPEILCDLAFDLTHLLREALDFHAALEEASEEHDPSYIQHPSIAPHDQNRFFHGWTRLIDLVRQAYEALLASQPERAAVLASVWSFVPFPVFRRLVLYAARIGGCAPSPSLLGLLASDTRNWLWATATQVELFATLPPFWSGLDGEARDQLVAMILAGPPREMFRDDLQPGEWEEIRDHSVWERLARLVRGGAVLGDGAASRLAQIEEAHASWRLTRAASEDFPTWMESGWGLPTDFSGEALFALGDADLLAALQQHVSNREGLLDSWRHAAAMDPDRAIRLLTLLIEQGYTDPVVWSQGLAAFRDEGGGVARKRSLLELLRRLPPDLLQDARVVRALADAIRAMASDISDEVRRDLLDLWDVVFKCALSVEVRGTDERVNDAINHPAGVLAEALLAVLRSRPLERGSGIEEDCRSRLDRILQTEGAAASLPRVIVASRLPLLHDLDPDWTLRVVIPLFDWRNTEEAQGAWQGFLWSPLLRPSLWVALKPHFIASFDHLESLGESRQNLAAILASISVEGENAISPIEAGQCIRKLDAAGRESVVIWLQRKLKEAGAQAPSLWRDSIGPWLTAAWPREPSFRSSGTSERLAWIATHSGDAFAEAVRCIVGIIGPVVHGYIILSSIEERGLLTTAPEACLDLVNAMTPDEPPSWFGPLRDFLERVTDARPQLADDQRFRRLRDIALRRRL